MTDMPMSGWIGLGIVALIWAGIAWKVWRQERLLKRLRRRELRLD